MTKHFRVFLMDHLYYFVHEEKTHHKFASDVNELILEFFHLLRVHSQSIPQVHLFGVDVRHSTVIVARYKAH